MIARVFAIVLVLVGTAAAAPPSSSAPGASAAPGAAPAPMAQPPMAPRMRMRPRAHGSFVDDLDCSACHTSDGWKLSSTAGASGFDHDRTGFPLRGAHVQTQCSGCHTGKAKPATTCNGCHRDPHAGRQVGACAECHRTTAWTDTTTLEQHRRTRMPLTGRHAALDCSDCHKRQGERMYSDTPSDCYACHSKDYHQATVHPQHDGGDGRPPFSRECGLCHQTTAWSPAYADPSTLPRNVMRTVDHDSYFVLTTGGHRGADCASCHPDARRTRFVRCDGCHSGASMRVLHRGPVTTVAASCLRCHPRGAAR